MSPLVYFWLFLKASLFSTGGMGNLPSLHADLIARKWATDRQFAQALTIGQISPGPNGLWVLCLGYLTYGVPGALMSTVAIVIPPFLIILADRAYDKIKDRPAVKGFVHGIGISVVGVFIVVLGSLLKSNGLTSISVTIVVIAFLLAISRRVSIPVLIAVGAAAGIALK